MAGVPHTTAAAKDVAPHDEVGVPDELLERCSCGVLYRTGGECLDCVRERED